MSVLARIGSGSAARSLFPGFVLCHDCSVSHAEPLPFHWPSLRIGILLVRDKPKLLSSRDAMNLMKDTSPFYSAWAKKPRKDAQPVQEAIRFNDIKKLGEVAEI